MKILAQFLIILSICLAGEILHRVVHIPLPGNIIGMLILLALLCTKVVKLEHIKDVSDFFLKHIAFFFLPPSIGIMAAGEEIMGRWPLLLAICVVLTVITMAVTGKTMQLSCRLQNFVRRRPKHD